MPPEQPSAVHARHRTCSPALGIGFQRPLYDGRDTYTGRADAARCGPAPAASARGRIICAMRWPALATSMICSVLSLGSPIGVAAATAPEQLVPARAAPTTPNATRSSKQQEDDGEGKDSPVALWLAIGGIVVSGALGP